MKASDWPPVGYEDRSWAAQKNDPRVDVWTAMRLDRPYHACVPARIAQLGVDCTDETLTVVDQAVTELARFDAEMADVPVVMPAVLLRTESASSSQIEHLTASARNLAFATLGLPSRQNAVTVAGNVSAMTEALSVSGPVTAPSILAIHEVLLNQTDAAIAGQWRTEQVWIGTSTLSPHDADFVPPHHERIAGCMDDLIAFAMREDMPALVQAAIVHAQFETIHPFVDGNGRTGRVLIQSLLRWRGLTKTTTVPVSSGLLRDTTHYFDALTAYRSGRPDDIVRQIADASLAAVENARVLASELVQLRTDWVASLTARSTSTAWDVIDLLFEQPVVNAEFVSARLDVSDRAARNAISLLENQQILSRPSAARRGQVWQATSILTALDEFSRRAGRRTR